MRPHLLTNFGIQKYYQNEPKFKGAYSGSNLPKIKNGAYLINIDECKSVGTHWVALYVHGNDGRASCDATYFDSFGVEYIHKSKSSYQTKNIITNIYRIQAYNSIIYGYFSIGFIDFMLKGKSLLDYTNLFSPNKYEKNDKIILKYLQ